MESIKHINYRSRKINTQEKQETNLQISVTTNYKIKLQIKNPHHLNGAFYSFLSVKRGLSIQSYG
jgi:hypothetical protein